MHFTAALVNVWSCTKGVVATAVAMLVERGLLAYDAPLARYWPEFAANGKGAITLNQVLSHQAGLDGVTVDMSLEDVYAGTPFVAALAAMAPLWEPGSRCVYHPVTFGHLLGEVVRGGAARQRCAASWWTAVRATRPPGGCAA